MLPRAEAMPPQIGHEEGTKNEKDEEIVCWFEKKVVIFLFGVDVQKPLGGKWGLNGIFKKDFKVIDNTLFPIYGTIGFFYHLK